MHTGDRTCALQIVTFHQCTNLLYPAHICISYPLHTQPSLILVTDAWYAMHPCLVVFRINVNSVRVHKLSTGNSSVECICYLLTTSFA
jgi:hypothetical protein